CKSNYCVFGACQVSDQCVNMQLHLGKLSSNQGAGYLILSQEDNRPDVYDPNTLAAQVMNDSSISVIKSGGNLRQIKLPQGAVDIVDDRTANNCYYIRFYNQSVV